MSVPILLVLLWQVGGSAGWWSTAVLPVPTDVAREFWILIENGQLPHNLLVSGQRVLIGAAVGISAGTVLGVAVGLWHRVDQAIDTTLQMMRTVPFLVILPLFILWFGVDELPKVLIIAIGTALPMYLNTSAGVRSVDPKLLEMGEQFGLDRPGLTPCCSAAGGHAEHPDRAPVLARISWLALVVAEQINAQEGLGFLISNAQALFQTEIIMVIVVVYALLGLATEFWWSGPRSGACCVGDTIPQAGRPVTAVEVRGLRRAFGDHIVLDGLDLTIDDFRVRGSGRTQWWRKDHLAADARGPRPGHRWERRGSRTAFGGVPGTTAPTVASSLAQRDDRPAAGRTSR